MWQGNCKLGCQKMFLISLLKSQGAWHSWEQPIVLCATPSLPSLNHKSHSDRSKEQRSGEKCVNCVPKWCEMSFVRSGCISGKRFKCCHGNKKSSVVYLESVTLRFQQQVLFMNEFFFFFHSHSSHDLAFLTAGLKHFLRFVDLFLSRETYS